MSTLDEVIVILGLSVLCVGILIGWYFHKQCIHKPAITAQAKQHLAAIARMQAFETTSMANTWNFRGESKGNAGLSLTH